jgi:glycine/D-amino acid oxidase-like deaminating enzyme
LNKSKIRYTIVGQGLCGSFLSYYLRAAGENIIVYDEPKPDTASKIASGIINPVTGRRIVKTWMIDTVMPFAVSAYKTMEEKLAIPIIQQINILDFHPTAQMHQSFEARLSEQAEFISKPNNPEEWRKYFNFPFGIGETNPCWLININTFLDEWRKILLNENLLVEQVYNEGQQNENEIVIFCDGVESASNKYFKQLPFMPNKGEVLLVRIKDLPKQYVYKQGISIVPWQDDLFWVGSSYEWEFQDALPSKIFLQKTNAQLSNWLKLPFTIEAHMAGIRPANLERRPFVGLHPIHPNIGILNGMGTKGCSLAPFFAKELADFLLKNGTITPEADIKRFSKILSR